MFLKHIVQYMGILHASNAQIFCLMRLLTALLQLGRPWQAPVPGQPLVRVLLAGEALLLPHQLQPQQPGGGRAHQAGRGSLQVQGRLQELPDQERQDQPHHHR